MNGQGKKILVLFDFDRTITRQDTLFLFLRFYKGNWRFTGKMLLLLPILLSYKLNIISNSKAKEKVLRAFLQNESIDKFEEKCQAFTKQRLSKAIRKKAKACIRAYQEEDAHIVVVTASPDCWVRPWCQQMRIACIGTRLESGAGKLTGKFAGLNCQGEEKVRRIKEEIPLQEYSTIIAYGDSKGDLPMLKLAHQSHYKPFR